MANSNPQKLGQLMAASADDRYSYFVRKVADFEEVWGLYKDGWALSEDDANQPAIAFWPEGCFAEACATDTWQGYTPTSIKLEDFLDKWLPGMQKDNVLAAVFISVHNKGAIVLPDKLATDIATELQQYE